VEDAHDAWAVISPAGELTWYPLKAERDVKALVGGPVAPGALDTATVTLHGIPPGRGPLKVLASDIALVFPDRYEPNPLAETVLRALSGGRIGQPWRGSVALVEYEVDPGTHEVLWPGEMCSQWAEAIKTAARAGGEPCC
jgi:hypothetical protein